MRKRGGIGIGDFAGRRVLITGAAGGIGLATAGAAGARGAVLFLTDIDEPGLEKAAGELRAAGAAVAHASPADLADHDAVTALGERIRGEGHAPMDVVMNVAGVSTWGTIERLEHSDWVQMVEINLLGPISVLETFVPPMIEAGRGGHVVNVSSAAGLFGLPWHAAYSAGKFGLRGVSEVLRFDLRKHRIGVSLVCPGAVRTPLVGTVKIVGVDRDSARMRKLVERFERRAAAPELVAERIVTAVERNRYMVYTSADVRIGHWVQRKFSPPYELAMRELNRQLDRLAR